MVTARPTGIRYTMCVIGGSPSTCRCARSGRRPNRRVGHAGHRNAGPASRRRHPSRQPTSADLQEADPFAGRPRPSRQPRGRAVAVTKRASLHVNDLVHNNVDRVRHAHHDGRWDHFDGAARHHPPNWPSLDEHVCFIVDHGHLIDHDNQPGPDDLLSGANHHHELIPAEHRSLDDGPPRQAVVDRVVYGDGDDD